MAREAGDKMTCFRSIISEEPMAYSSGGIN